MNQIGEQTWLCNAQRENESVLLDIHKPAIKVEHDGGYDEEEHTKREQEQ